MKNNIHQKIINLPALKKTFLQKQHEVYGILKYEQKSNPSSTEVISSFPKRSAGKDELTLRKKNYNPVIQCEYCLEPIYSPHGNQRYHPKCAYEEKKDRSKRQYATLNFPVYEKLIHNDRILHYLYAEQGIVFEFAPHYLLDFGFFFRVYSSIQVLNGITFFCMKHYAFYFLINKNIVIWEI